MPKNTSHKSFFVAAGIFLLLSCLCLFIYLGSRREVKMERKIQVETAGNLAAQDFVRSVNENLISLKNFKNRVEESDGGYFAYFEPDSRRILKRNPAIKFVQWIDSSGIIRATVPEVGNESVLNLDIKSLGYRYPEWLEKSQDTLVNISQWMHLAQKKNMFLADVPLYYNGSFQGTITAGMDMKTEFDLLSAKLSDYSITIRDQRGTIFYEHNSVKSDREAGRLGLEIPLYIESRMEKPWLLQFTLTNDSALNRNTQIIAFILGIVLTSLISLLVYYYLKAKRETHRYESGNIALQKMNEELALQKEMANKASEAKTRFLANMSHEIRTPLSAILGFVDILEGQSLTPSDKEYVSLMRHSSDTLLSLVNNILEFDKIESGTVFLTEDRFKPKALIENLVKTYSEKIKIKDLSIESDFNQEEANPVIGDRIKTEQIFINILNNAIKFTERGTITVIYNEQINNEKVDLKCSIKDTGIGIPKDKLNEIFDRFIQADSGLRKRHIGSGLGLAITKELVGLLKGEIQVSSKVGKGTIFSISLSFPLAEPLSEVEAIDFKELNFNFLKVLIVDDNKLNRMILAKILNKIGIDSETAEGGKEALLLTKNKHYDLIFMDVHMPGIDGFEIVKRIRKENKETIIFGLSADVTQSAIEEGIKCGMNDYLTKPIEQGRLFSILNSYFRA